MNASAESRFETNCRLYFDPEMKTFTRLYTPFTSPSVSVSLKTALHYVI